MDNEQLLKAISEMMDKKLADSIQPVNNRLDKMESEFNNRLDKVESEISSLKVGQIELKKELQEIKHKVNDTYDLALDAWGQSTENREWLEYQKATS